jgi:hypothetical protein
MGLEWHLISGAERIGESLDCVDLCVTAKLFAALIAFERSWIALITRSSVVNVGCVMCLCLK